ncbi:hypothetical protein ACU8KH_00437 [Lachancea thermotolerans]
MVAMQRMQLLLQMITSTRRSSKIKSSRTRKHNTFGSDQALALKSTDLREKSSFYKISDLSLVKEKSKKLTCLEYSR